LKKIFKWGRSRFHGSGRDDHQLYFFVRPYAKCTNFTGATNVTGGSRRLHTGVSSNCSRLRCFYTFTSWPTTMWGPAIVMIRIIRLTRISTELGETDVWLLGNSNWNRGFLVQNLPSNSRLEVRFQHFGCFSVGTLPLVTEMGNR